jgi:hypothetical protein
LGELLDYVAQRYSKNNSASDDIMRKTRIKNVIAGLCDTYLKAGCTLEFEVLPRDIEYAMSVFDEEPLKSTVVVTQVSDSLFHARLIELDVAM